METKIGLWRGKPIEELDKPELLEVIKFLSGEQERNRKDREMMGDDYWKGKKLSKKHKANISRWHEENKMFWKGDNVGYHGIHKWVQKELGKANKCELCNGESSQNYQWSNKKHTYKRNKEDWWMLCSSCHKIYDIYTFDMKYKSGARSEKLMSTLRTSINRANQEAKNMQ